MCQYTSLWQLSHAQTLGSCHGTRYGLIALRNTSPFNLLHNGLSKDLADKSSYGAAFPTDRGPLNRNPKTASKVWQQDVESTDGRSGRFVGGGGGGAPSLSVLVSLLSVAGVRRSHARSITTGSFL